ncbi:MAG: tetratricopeptide repeat protein [Nitrospirae bacterium]|nr:tetratricopeptide repeat protein [Nitrospirota bacterium]
MIFFLFILSGCGSLPRIVILEDPLSAEEHIVLGATYETKGLLDQAILEYKAALDKDRSNSKAMVNLGNVYYKKGDFDAAQGAYSEALKIDRDNPYAGNNLAWIYVEKDIRLAEAEDLAASAVEKDPKNRAYYLETLALVYYKMGRYDDALKRLDEAELSAKSGDEQLRKTLAEDREKILGSIKQRE